MDIEQYIKNRVDDQIDWYDNKSVYCQKRYKFLQITEIVFAALIPLLSAYSKNQIVSIIVGLLGAAIAIIESITKLNKYHENWIEYRTTCELLRYQKYLFETHSSPYNQEEETVENLFVRNVENIISSENNKWKLMNLEEKSKSSTNQ